MKGKTAVIALNDVQHELYRKITEKGYPCEKVSFFNTYHLKEYLNNFERIILPFPSKRENIPFLSEKENLSEVLNDNQVVIGGMISDEIKDDLDGQGVPYIDYFEAEDYVLKNAYLTSQGALRLLLENTRSFLPGKSVLVTGYGRIGRSLSFMLRGLGLNVFVAARSPVAIADAASSGFNVFSISQMKSTLFYYDYIFNTVPYNIFTEADISRMNKDTVYFELASSPFGANRDDFEKYRKQCVSASALPGRFFPEAVAENIFSFITAKGR